MPLTFVFWGFLCEEEVIKGKELLKDIQYNFQMTNLIKRKGVLNHSAVFGRRKVGKENLVVKWIPPIVN